MRNEEIRPKMEERNNGRQDLEVNNCKRKIETLTNYKATNTTIRTTIEPIQLRVPNTLVARLGQRQPSGDLGEDALLHDLGDQPVASLLGLFSPVIDRAAVTIITCAIIGSPPLKHAQHS